MTSKDMSMQSTHPLERQMMTIEYENRICAFVATLRFLDGNLFERQPRLQVAAFPLRDRCAPLAER
jgi:hypothetical protein